MDYHKMAERFVEDDEVPEGELRTSGRLLKKGHGKSKLGGRRGWKMRQFVLDKGNPHFEKPPVLAKRRRRG